MKLIVKAPVRIDFAGGWTDIELWTSHHTGAVLNATINHYVEGTLETLENHNQPSLSNTSDIALSYRSNIPAGSGLGTSASMNVVFLFLIRYDYFHNKDLSLLAEAAFQMEQILHIKGGKQDQYAAVFGGFQFMSFDEKVHTEHLVIPSDIKKILTQRLILCYTGKSRLSGNIHQKVWRRYEQGLLNETFRGLTATACSMKEALLSGDLPAFATLLNRNWEYQKNLDESITNEEVERFFITASAAGAIAGKACGAGGGGCLLFYCEEEQRSNIERALTEEGATIIPFSFEEEGLTWKWEK